MKKIHEELDAYLKNFDQIVQKRVERDRAVNDVMNPMGGRLRVMLTDVQQAAIKDGEMAVAAHAGVVVEHCCDARSGIWQRVAPRSLQCIRLCVQRGAARAVLTKSIESEERVVRLYLAGPLLDEHASGRRLEENRIALTDVEERHAQGDRRLPDGWSTKRPRSGENDERHACSSQQADCRPGDHAVPSVPDARDPERTIEQALAA